MREGPITEGRSQSIGTLSLSRPRGGPVKTGRIAGAIGQKRKRKGGRRYGIFNHPSVKTGSRREQAYSKGQLQKLSSALTKGRNRKRGSEARINSIL